MRIVVLISSRTAAVAAMNFLFLLPCIATPAIAAGGNLDSRLPHSAVHVVDTPSTLPIVANPSSNEPRPQRKHHRRNLRGHSISQFGRQTFTTECIECEQASSARVTDTDGGGEAATNNFDRPDDKEDNITGFDDKGGENEDEDADVFYFEPTLEPTFEADRPVDNTIVTTVAIDPDANKYKEAEEEKIECKWCHDDQSPPKRPPSPQDDGFQGTSSDDDSDPPSYADKYGDGDGLTSRLIDDMVAPFFLLAAILLILALVYTLLFLCVVRLGTIRIDEDRYPRGRVYFCGDFCFVPLCWFYRLYAADPSGGVGIASSTDAKVMGLRREERKEAVVELLTQYSVKVGENGEEEKAEDNEHVHGLEIVAAGTDITASTDDDDGNGDVNEASENQCSICLDGYEQGDTYVTWPTTCPHRFHHDCLLDWLTRRVNTACPCCRRDLISNDDVWEVHQRIGREKRRRKRKERGWPGNGIRGRIVRFRRREGEQVDVGVGMDEGDAMADDTVPAMAVTEPSSPASGSSADEERNNAEEPSFQTEEHEVRPVEVNDGDVEMGRM
mmetsp:Transcript_35210/g.77171  ORF Transcript_35210/g.77171 Transcript_35210/m.77171 type:complete len:557 (+) Transcript_35210:203-1873(+)